MATPDQLIQDAQKRMDASVEHTKTEFNTVRTGRASAALLDRVQIDYYGQQTPLKQLATINVPEPRMLTIQPFDPSSIKAIEKALQESDLGLTPSNDGKVIRLPIPQLTEPSLVEPRALLPSFLYFGEPHEIESGEVGGWCSLKG